jgi:hypothetical protein
LPSGEPASLGFFITNPGSIWGRKCLVVGQRDIVDIVYMPQVDARLETSQNLVLPRNVVPGRYGQAVFLTVTLPAEDEEIFRALASKTVIGKVVYLETIDATEVYSVLRPVRTIFPALLAAVARACQGFRASSCPVRRAQIFIIVPVTIFLPAHVASWILWGMQEV